MEDCPDDKAGRHAQHRQDRLSQVAASVEHWHSFDLAPAMPPAPLHGPLPSTSSYYLWQPAGKNSKKTSKVGDPAVALEALLERDRNYASAQRKQQLARVYPVYAARDVRLYRPGNLPYVGVQAATDALANAIGTIKWQPIGGDVSRAGDLGYTHGTYEVTDDTKNVTEKGSYVRIWKKRNGMWRIVMDVANPQ